MIWINVDRAISQGFGFQGKCDSHGFYLVLWQRVLCVRRWVLWKGAGSEHPFTAANPAWCFWPQKSHWVLTACLWNFHFPKAPMKTYRSQLFFFNWKALFWKLKHLPVDLWLLPVQSFLFMKLECTALKLLGSWILIRVLDLGEMRPLARVDSVA